MVDRTRAIKVAGWIAVPVTTVEERKDEIGLFRSLVQNSPDALVVVGEDLIIRYANPSAERLLGYQTGELEDARASDFLNLRALKGRCSALDKRHGSLAKPDSPIEFEVRHADGTLRHLEATSADLLDDPHVRGRAYYIRDITGRKEAEEDLIYRAFHDSLTGLATRDLFVDRLQHALTGATRSRTPVTVLVLDIDDFKTVNDSFGHGVGDLMLTMVAQRLRASLRPGETISRLGGDEFAVLLSDPASARDASGVAARIVEVLRKPISWDAHTLFATASVGVATSGPKLRTVEDLMNAADTAMYRAKKNGKAQHVVFEEEMSAEALEGLELESDLRRAVDRGEFSLHYQPEVLLENGQIFCLEALLRWNHPERGTILPLEFITTAEETGLIVQIGRWVLREACRQALLWRERYADAAPLVSVNLSARQFQQPGLTETVAAILAETGLPPRCLILEITESLLMDIEHASNVLRRLKGLGVRLAIDDFGIGYSSLSYLEHFTVDHLKMDRSFVYRMRPEVEGSEVLVPLLIELAHRLGLTAVAEGVETGEQLERLREMGCDIGQGNYFSEPLPDTAVYEFLDSGNTPPGRDSGLRRS